MAAAKQKRWYLVKVEAIAPVIVEFRVNASSPDEAFQMVDKAPQQAELVAKPQIDFRRLKKIRAMVRDSLSGVWIKKL